MFRFALIAGWVCVAGTADAQTLQRINPDGLATPQTYSHVVRVGKVLYVAGQVAADGAGTPVEGSMREQVERTLANLKIALASQGADFSHIAKITIFVTSIEEFLAPDVRQVRATYFGEHRPASTLVQVVRLAHPAYRVEIEAVAALP
jgi:enamine deaminase RidA (YjgF/YER057c/UK114 family)